MNAPREVQRRVVLKRRERVEDRKAFAADVLRLRKALAFGQPLPEQERQRESYRVAIGLNFIAEQLRKAAATLPVDQALFDGCREAMAIMAHIVDGADHPIQDFYLGVERRGSNRMDHAAEDYLDGCFAAFEVILGTGAANEKAAWNEFSRWARFAGERLTWKQWSDLYRGRSEARPINIGEWLRIYIEMSEEKGMSLRSSSKLILQKTHNDLWGGN